LSLLLEKKINLDLPPEKRWKHLAQKYADRFESVMAYVKVTEMEQFGGPLFGSKIASVISSVAGYLSQSLTPAYIRGELEGIAEITSNTS